MQGKLPVLMPWTATAKSQSRGLDVVDKKQETYRGWRRRRRRRRRATGLLGAESEREREKERIRRRENHGSQKSFCRQTYFLLFLLAGGLLFRKRKPLRPKLVELNTNVHWAWSTAHAAKKKYI